MSRPSVFRALGPALILTLSTAAQVPPAQLAGWVHPGGTAKSGRIELQNASAGCRPAKTLCNGVLWPQSTIAGAAAYDARHHAVWVSDGTRLEEWSLSGCRKRCIAKPLIMAQGAEITGLATSETPSLLWQLESKRGYYGLLPYDKRRCPPVPLRGGCGVTLSNSRATAQGLAYDPVRNLLFYTVSEPGFLGFVETLFVAPAVVGKACKPICKFRLRPCKVGQGPPITGLAYDACSQKLYLTNGDLTRVLLVKDPSRCRFVRLPCCSKQTLGSYRGLTVVPGWSKRTIGSPCIAKGCALCLGIAAALEGGTPALGNPDFAISIHGAPLGSFGLLYLGVGKCSGGLKLPFLCGNFYPALAPTPPILLPVGVLHGSLQCTGTTRMPLPIPTDSVFCRLRLCAQWLVFCGAVPANGMTPAIEFTFAG